MSRPPDWVPVARWELTRILRRADFVISVLITPVIAIGAGYLPDLLSGRGAPPAVAVVRLDAAGEPRADTTTLAPLEGVRWMSPPGDRRRPEALAEDVRARRWAAALVVPDGYATGDSVTLIVGRGAPRWQGRVRDHLRGLARAERAAARGLSAEDLASLDREVGLRRVTARGGPEAAAGRRAQVLVVLAITLLMVVVVLSTISYLIVGISAEKQARVTEVVVSAVPAEAWMDGKLVAYTVIGLIMAVVWAASLIGLAMSFAFSMPGSLHAGTLAVTLVYAVLGLYLYNALFAGLMATLQGIQSTSKFQGYFFLIPFVPMFVLPAVFENPDAAWLAVLSLVPLFSSALVPARLAMEAAPSWEVAAGIVLLVAACWIARRLAGRIFRIGMLLYGKDLTLPEIVRWARER